MPDKKTASAREDAPLLADDTAYDEHEPGFAENQNNDQPTTRRSLRDYLTRFGRWILKNRMVVAILCLLLGGFIALCVYFGAIYKSQPEIEPETATICVTPVCVLAASEILQNMSPRYREIDPCTRFDDFVCEGWQEKHVLRADQDSSFTGTLMQENSEIVLRHLLETPFSDSHPRLDPHSSAEASIFGKLKDAYDACMDEGRLHELGSQPLITVLRKIEELFPAARPHSSSEPFPQLLHEKQKGIVYSGENQLATTVGYLASIGVESIISFSVGADDRDPDSVILSVSPLRRPGLPSKEYYNDSDMIVAYSKTIALVLEALLFESDPNSTRHSGGLAAKSESLIQDLVTFETKLAEATPPAEEAEDVTQYYNPRTLEETRSLLPQLSISYIIASLAPTGYTTDRVIVGSPPYLKAVASILKNTSPETLQAYFVWKTVQHYAYKIEDDALKPLLRFNNELQGKDPDATGERWRTCVKVVDNGLSWILSKFFIEKAFSEEAKAFGDRIVSDIKSEFIKKLHGTAWMSEDVRKQAIAKVHNIVQKIGYPTSSPDVRNAVELQDYYDPVNITNTEFFENAISIARFDISREWSALGKPTDRDEWGMSVPTVNAYYNPAGNEIVFPAGIMQAPVFYNPAIPQYLSYGAFGSVSGHELSHAFDSTGRHYDETGNFTEWWSNDTVQAFKEKAQCFIDQYHDFTVPGLGNEDIHVNGRLTLGENIADAGGLSASFAAWREHEKKNPGELLPGLQGFSKDQMFFISYSNWWCGTIRKEAAIDRIYRDPHAPKWARIIGAMANSRAFRESFSCPQKEPTCELW